MPQSGRALTAPSWAKREHIVYFRAIRFVPHEMKAGLPGELHAALDTRVSKDDLAC